MRMLPVLPLLALLIALPGLAAQERAFIDTPEPPTPSSVEAGKPWEEAGYSLPPWPREEDLIAFTLDRPSSFRYFLDGRHLAVGSDGVVRYTLVAETASGARNLSVEGLRCTARGQYRIYAYGRGGRFHPVDEARSRWLGVHDHPGDALHRELHGHFLCGPRTFAPRPEGDIIRALRGRIGERDNAGFLSD